jgi:DNA-binding response OmpR family regulator
MSAAPRVLLVDDDPVVRTMARIALERLARCEVWAVDAPDCTPDKAAGFRPDLLVLDLRLGRLDGRELLRELRRHPGLAATPALFCSGLDEAEVRGRLPDAGFIGKPFTAQELAAKVRRVLARGPA